MHSTFNSADPISKRVDPIKLIAGIPLERYFDFVTVFGSIEIADFFEERVFGVVQVTDKVSDTAVVLKL